MPVAQALRQLEIDIPALPDVLVRLSLLMAEDEVNLHAVAQLIEGDMALAAAVMKAVNSSLYGLKGRVQSAQQAITFLGTAEVSAITFEIGLRAAFAQAGELEPLWKRAAERGVLMGRLAQGLGQDAWAAHSAGLFEECGKAVLFRHDAAQYRPLLEDASDDTTLCAQEHAAFGVSHDALGAALCESWGLASHAVVCVRLHVQAQAQRVVPAGLALPRRGLLGLSLLAHAMMNTPDDLEAVAEAVAPAMEHPAELLLRNARRLLERQEEALQHGR
ncbi:putative signal transduction protein [Burkholderiales bacterium JOSHI_001]|nr:putative signal transduction protein [Burkholderiales bacterium JOSHI_001]